MYDDRSPELPSRKRKRDFARTVKLADAVIAGNKYLADHALEFSGKVKVLPTGLRLEDYSVVADRGQSSRVVLVWIGSKSTLKYLAEIKPALEEIGSRFDNAILRIICDDFLGLNNMEVEERRWSGQTQVLDLATSDIGLAPLPNNRFTRGKCGFKILQYAAAKLPVVASPVGVNAEYVCDGVTGFHAINISQWIDKIGELIENAELRKRMGQEGHVQVQQFDLKVLAKQLLGTIKECLKNIES
jgi:glycosyltransferase involved in cell wall biosynthesis